MMTRVAWVIAAQFAIVELRNEEAGAVCLVYEFKNAPALMYVEVLNWHHN